MGHTRPVTGTLYLYRSYFWNKTLRVSDSSSVHHQEFFTVHIAMVHVIQVLLTACEQDQDGIGLVLLLVSVHLVGFIIIIYHDARSPERQTYFLFAFHKITSRAEIHTL